MPDELTSAITEDAAILRSVLATAVDAIITIDDHGLIRHVNASACRMFGYASDELIGRNVSCLMPPPYRDEHDQYLLNYVRTGEAKIIGIGREVVGRRKDGSVMPIHLAVSESSFGRQRLFTGIVRDITELKNAQQKLIQSERLAAIGQMVTGLAHESRNALQRSRAFQDMLELELEGNSEQLGLVRQTQQALQELQQLYEEVRGYAAPIKLELSPCDPVELCQGTWDNLSAQHAAREIRFRSDSLDANGQCLCDCRRIQQVFRNILENAIVVSPEGGEITLSTRSCELDGGPALRMAIRDQGPGLSSEQAARIFEPFYTTKTRGTGLGMAIARRIVEAHGGVIGLGEASQAGAEVVVTLPVSLPVTA
jgi:two-component system, LuxR family, sensor kinase FixL